MALYSTAGCKIYIGGAAMSDQSADFAVADFSGVTWTEIDGWSQMGAFGDAAQEITTPLINRSRDVKQKGTRNAGSMQNVFAHIADDAGQLALIAAEATNDNYPFKIEFNDAPNATGTPTTKYFIGLVLNANFAGGDANTIRNINSTISINSNFATADPVAGV